VRVARVQVLHALATLAPETIMIAWGGPRRERRRDDPAAMDAVTPGDAKDA
jgi:hypothetical protein